MSAWSIEWAAVPSVCRRIAVIVVLACLCAGLPASVVLAQDAGDQQYQDPFAGSTTTTKTSSKPKSQTQTTTTPSEELTPAPQTSGPGSSGSSGSGGSSGSSATTTTPTATTPAASSGGLPNTGVDARVLLLAGGALLLLGLGIRLRTTPERF
jgi:LPXTG-motif cell wall-anchored protein